MPFRSRPARRPLALAAALAALLALLAGCSGGSGSTRSVGSATGPSTQSGAPLSSSSTGADSVGSLAVAQKVSWRRCHGRFECTTIKVPLDYAKPNGKTLSLAVVRLPARDQKHRIGSVLVNPGGPGASGIEFAEAQPLPSDILDRFDLVGFDPRGVGQSSPVTCGDAEKLYAADPIPDDAAETSALVDASKAYIDACEAKFGDVLPHLGTRNVARDMDQIRIALDEPKISYVGFSYGTSIGQEYADLFPTRIRAMVLDGVVDVSQSGLAGAEAQGIAFQKALDNFVAYCKATPSCPLQPDPQAVINRVQAQTQAHPIPAPSADRPLGPGEFQLGVIEPLYSRSSWPALARALAEAASGDGSDLVSLADDYLSIGGFEIYFAVSCLDSSWPTGKPQAVIEAGQSIAAQAPNVGEATVTDYIRCALWPTPPQPLTAPKATGSPTIVVVSTTNDPATPYENGVKLAKELPHAVLITHEGEGHTAYSQGDSCIDDAVDKYLLTLEAPASNLTCH
jgi:pimeloyl-ACP methyl ester carboxylesterase